MVEFTHAVRMTHGAALRAPAMALPATPLDQATDLQSGLAARHAIRAGRHRGPTAGLAPGYVQGNLVILPQDVAADFQRFCELNPKPCPLIGTVGAGRLAHPGAG